LLSEPPWLHSPAANFLANDQGMDSLDELRELTDTEVESLMKIVHRPGGTVPNPEIAIAAVNGVAPAAGIPLDIPIPGFQVSQRAKSI